VLLPTKQQPNRKIKEEDIINISSSDSGDFKKCLKHETRIIQTKKVLAKRKR
jgi:hypothetical protein